MEEEERFEDVVLGDDVKPRKKGIFSRIGETLSEAPSSTNNSRPSSTYLGFLPGRKRAQSGQGSELGNVNGQPQRTEVEGTV